MVISTEPPFGLSELDEGRALVRTYENALVYGDMDGETVLHEGPVRVLANGWVSLPSGRLLSPDAVHHVDPATELDDEDEPTNRRASDSGWGDD
ncbi:hypothetical protein [Halovivax cerinus]|uniref:Uncharacterized protein n=1 Tax=Halovivax cerinus TaxID=1487865 RepID=A0ABD5NRW5_9EURY|nr:hypothetical protein [Halovivax cerinus]